MDNIFICSVRNKILVESSIPPCSVRNKILVESNTPPYLKSRRDVICRKKYGGFVLFILWITILTLTASVYAEQEPQPVRKTLTPSEQRKLDYVFFEALNLKNAGKYDAAFELFRHCLAIDSTASAVLYELSSYYLQMDEPENAVSLLKDAVRYSPDNFTYKLALASISLAIGMFGEAAEAYEELVRAYPDKIELNYYLAEAYTQQGEIGQAIETFDALEEIVGMNEAISVQKYRLYMLLEQSDKAFLELKKLADKYPANARYPLLIGDLHLEKKEHEQALEYYRNAFAIDPENPYYTVSMANYYEVTGNPEAAEEQVRLALVNDKLDVELKVGILSRYIQQLQMNRNATEGANTLFQTLLEQHPEEIELKLMYATLLAIQENMEEARFQLQLVTEMDPLHERAWQQLLQLSFQTQDYEEAIQVGKKSIELFPEESFYYFYLGLAYYQQKNYQEAINTYQEGLTIIREEERQLKSDFYGQIGDTYFQMKKPEDAFASYDEALKYNERNIGVLNNYSYFLTLSKRDLDKAERMSAQCIRMEPNNATYLDTYAWVFFMQGNYTLAKIYIENAVQKDTTGNPVLVDHYGDILYKSGDKEGALKQWMRAKEMGKESEILNRKIEEKTYFEDPDNE